MRTEIAYAEWFLRQYSIGPKLRGLRTKKKLTLARLAQQTGLSTALLSKLETDRMIPTLSTLAVICKRYGVGLSHFFCEAERHSMSLTRKAHLQTKFSGTENARFVALNVPGPESRLSSEMIEICPASSLSLSKPDRETCAVVFVLDGRLQVRSGAMIEVMETGDSVHVESSMEMFWSNPGKHPCRLLVVRPWPGAGPTVG